MHLIFSNIFGTPEILTQRELSNIEGYFSTIVSFVMLLF